MLRYKKRIGALGIFFLLIPAIAPAVSGRNIQAKETRVEEYLNIGDGYYLRGDYQKAIENYSAAAGLTQQKINQSRAYFGLSLSTYYLGDASNSRMWLKKVFEVDPQKEISSLFYPDGFVKLFNEVKKEPAGAPAAVPDKQETVPTWDVSREVRTEPKPASKTPPVSAPLTYESLVPRNESPGGNWEIDVHTGSWSVNLIKSLFEKSITKRIGSEVRNEMTDQLSASHVDLIQSSYEQTLTFDSGGSNYGLEARYYPGGRNGTFSLGFALEKTSIRFDVAGAVKQNYSNGSSAKVDAAAFIEAAPFIAHFNFRWDFGRDWMVVPYFVFGLGFGSMSGTLTYNYTGTFQYEGLSESVSEQKTKTFEELGKENDNYLTLNFIVMVQAMFGLKADVYKGLTLKAEAGIWDGFVFRGALAYRF